MERMRENPHEIAVEEPTVKFIAYPLAQILVCAEDGSIDMDESLTDEQIKQFMMDFAADHDGVCTEMGNTIVAEIPSFHEKDAFFRMFGMVPCQGGRWLPQDNGDYLVPSKVLYFHLFIA